MSSLICNVLTIYFVSENFYKLLLSQTDNLLPATQYCRVEFPIFVSTAESVQLWYTNRNVRVRIVHVVLVVNDLIRAHYNIIMKTTVESGGKLPVS